MVASSLGNGVANRPKAFLVNDLQENGAVQLILPTEPNECELNSIRHDPDRLAEIRRRLSDISWWMRVLCQRIAIRANHDDGEPGKFWQSRFRAVRLMDEESLLACAATSI